MSGDVTKPSIEALFRLSGSELEDKLAPALEEIRGYGIGKLLGEYPVFVGRLLEKLRQAEAAKLLSEAPDLAEPLTSLLWEGVVFRAGRSKEMKSVLENAERDFHCNIEASDSPFISHFIVEKGDIRGAPGYFTSRMKIFGSWGPQRYCLIC